MKVGLIGIGYWGKIILKTLKFLGVKDITICDPTLINQAHYESHPVESDYTKLPKLDMVFIIVPATLHYKICSYFLFQGADVFCEKPLTVDTQEAKKLYHIARENECNLMTDWLFTYNPQINQLKQDYTAGNLGEIRSVHMNRLNSGPARTDVNARWDLASHDVSILQYLFDQQVMRTEWIDYRRNPTSYQEDSALGHIEYTNFVAIINASWEYRDKVRDCVFEFDKTFVTWDDNKKSLHYSHEGQQPPTDTQSPLNISIKQFLNKEYDMGADERLTHSIIQTLSI